MLPLDLTVGQNLFEGKQSMETGHSSCLEKGTASLPLGRISASKPLGILLIASWATGIIIETDPMNVSL